MRFRFDPLSRAFSNRCVFNENAQIENAQLISVDGKPKRIEMYAFSNENALGWTGSKTAKTLRFQKYAATCGRGLREEEVSSALVSPQNGTVPKLFP